jgi:hypothetical protein
MDITIEGAEHRNLDLLEMDQSISQDTPASGEYALARSKCCK